MKLASPFSTSANPRQSKAALRDVQNRKRAVSQNRTPQTLSQDRSRCSEYIVTHFDRASVSEMGSRRSSAALKSKTTFSTSAKTGRPKPNLRDVRNRNRAVSQNRTPQTLSHDGRGRLECIVTHFNRWSASEMGSRRSQAASKLASSLLTSEKTDIPKAALRDVENRNRDVSQHCTP